MKKKEQLELRNENDELEHSVGEVFKGKNGAKMRWEAAESNDTLESAQLKLDKYGLPPLQVMETNTPAGRKIIILREVR